MAFGLFPGQYTLSMWISLVVIGLVLYFFDEIKEPVGRVGLALVLGGTIGNLIDRIVYEHVIDYLNFVVWPVFNLADMALTIGMILLIISYWKK